MRFRLGMAAFYDKHVRTSGLLLIQIRLVRNQSLSCPDVTEQITSESSQLWFELCFPLPLKPSY